MSNSAASSTSQNHADNINNAPISQSFRDQKQLQTYIKQSNLLKIIEGVTEQYIKTYQQTKRSEDALAAIIVQLSFVYNDFLKYRAVDLLHLAIEEPQQFAEATKYAVFYILRDLVKASTPRCGLKTIDIEQVHLKLRFIGLPVQDDLLFDTSCNRYRTGLSHFIGILSACTQPEKLVLQSIWYCSTGCPRNKIKSESTESPICNSCSRPMSEYTKLRVTQNECRLRLLPPASVCTPRITNKIFRALTVRLKDHVYDCKLLLGSRYLITGYYNYYNNVQEFQAWNLSEH